MSLLKTSIICSSVLKQFVIFPICIRCVKNVRKQYSTRCISNEHVTRLEKTFIGRLLTYLKNGNMTTTESDRSEEILNILKNDNEINLKKFSTEEIISTLTSVTDHDLMRNRFEFSEMLNALGTEFCKRLNHLTIRDKLNILHAYMRIIPNEIVRYSYYKMAIKEIFSKLETLNKNDLIQLIFYIGLQKKHGNSQYMLKKCLKSITKLYVNDLTIEDLCIICSSTFKTSTKIDDKSFLSKITGHLNDNLHLCSDSAILVTLIKTIRHNHCTSEDLLTTLSCTIVFNKTIEYYSFTALCHILALYSDFLYYDENLIKMFTEKGIKLLRESDYTSRNTYMIEQPRVKDIKGLLWCLSNLNYNYLNTDDIKTVIIPNIMKRVEAGELNDDSATLVDIILYLWMLNYQAYELVPFALTKQNIQIMKASKSPAKYRLNLLLSCIYFENRTLYRQLNVQLPENFKYDLKRELKKRPVLKKITESLKTVATHCNINKFEVGFQVPYLVIGGITGYKKNIYKAIHIELLDEHTSLKNTNHVPNGLMQLKLRILEKLEEELIVIQANDIELMTNEELHNFLLDEINFVC